MHWDEIKPDHVTKDRWLWYRATSKNNDPLEIPLSSYATKILDELKEITGGKGFVFAAQRRDGTTGHRSDSWKPVERLQAASGVSDFTNHAVRKTITTYLTRALDVPTDVVTAVLNHRLPGPKANENYIHALLVRRMRDALETWGAYLSGICALEDAPGASKTTRGRSQPKGARRSATGEDKAW